jgi:hypothetical protein
VRTIFTKLTPLVGRIYNPLWKLPFERILQELLRTYGNFSVLWSGKIPLFYRNLVRACGPLDHLSGGTAGAGREARRVRCHVQELLKVAWFWWYLYPWLSGYGSSTISLLIPLWQKSLAIRKEFEVGQCNQNLQLWRSHDMSGIK